MGLFGRSGEGRLLISLHYKPEVPRLILDGVIGICHWLKPFVRTMTLVLTQSITEMSTINIFWEIKDSRADNFTSFTY
jgi:hypothetical protein